MQSLREKLKDKLITLETTPPKLPTIKPMIEKLQKSEAYKYVDGFSTTDCPLSKLKFNSIIAAYRLQEAFKKPVIATMTMRDRNLIALQSDLLGANELDVTHILAITGDSVRISDQKAKGVLEGNSLLLLEIIEKFNNGQDFMGNPFKIPPKPITPFGVSNSYAKNFTSIEKKIYKKASKKVAAIITQPIYNIEIAKKFIEIRDNIKKEFRDFEIVFGFFPITKLKTALFLQKNVPGIYVPNEWIENLQKAQNEKEEELIGFEMSKELFKKLFTLNPRIHIMTANHFEIVKKLLE
jgi:5,10-methylenetetrahydrofolate reductase